MNTETFLQNAWLKSKLLVKTFIILLLVLILQIPTMYVRDLVSEREDRQKQAIAEVSSKWADRQNIAGPFIVLPFNDVVNNGQQAVQVKRYAFFLPNELHVRANITPHEKYRGIYKVLLYEAGVQVSGSFTAPDPAKLNIAADRILWSEAFVKMNLSDVRGLNEELKMQWNGQELNFQPAADGSGDVLTAPLHLTGPLDTASFSSNMTLAGSEQLLVTPIGRATTVDISSKWPHPSFTGDLLPQQTSVTDSGFHAIWKSTAVKRTFPQQWVDDAYTFNTSKTTDAAAAANIASAAFGTELFVPVNGYQKTMRTVKYAALCILLTFTCFFLIEATNKTAVHPFHYALIGLALVLFYTLLLSISEYMGFESAYVIASVSTVALIAWFVRGLLGSLRLTSILSITLCLLYTYVFTILELQDYSLLLGSIGLFVALAAVMHFSKKIQW